MTEPRVPQPLPPGTSAGATRIARRLSDSVERFLHVEASSGVLLLAMAVFALLWANSPWSSTYSDLLDTHISLGFGDHSFTRTVHFWVNDILMVVFFFVVGLEVRRELFEGELSTPRRAALPAVAALGGMIAPVTIYLALNAGSPAAKGWAVPMATDIAFAVGILALLGRRVPPPLRVVLLALAIIDDIGAILVIALVYTSGVEVIGFAVAGGGIAMILLMQRAGVRDPFLYVVPGVVLWAGVLQSGVHPTIAGVILGLLTPVQAWFGHEGFQAEAEGVLDRLRTRVGFDTDPRALLPELERMNVARQEAVPPVTRIEAALHPWVAFGIMPLFALANAGVSFDGLGAGASGTTALALGIGLGLVVGKPLGVVALSWLSVRLGIASLPQEVSWGGMLVVGCAAGIGFTMALFIGALAFSDESTLGVAKVAVLAGSAVAGIATIALGYRFLSPGRPADSSAEGIGVRMESAGEGDGERQGRTTP